jgi:oligopeptidase B
MMPGTSADLDDRRYRSYDTDDFVYSLRSFTRPVSVYSYHLNINTLEWSTQFIASDTTYEQYGYDPSLYVQERIWSLSSDGHMIPTSLVYRRDMYKHGANGGNPMYMCGYGAYGGVEETQFDADYISLLDRGVIHAWAHIRGTCLFYLFPAQPLFRICH